MLKIKASDFKTRAELDAHIEQLETSCQIVGTVLELKKKHLSIKTRVHGNECIIVDEKGVEIVSSEPAKKRVDRGKVYKSSISSKSKKVLDINSSQE